MRKLLLSLAAFTAFTAPAQAVVVINDNFDGENGGLTGLTYTGFANFSVEGAVDLLRSGDWGVTCNGGTGSCVDLAGTPGPGALVSGVYNFGSGASFDFTIVAGGSQRIVGDTDDLFLTLFDGATNTVLQTWTWNLASTDGFSSFMVSYAPMGAGSAYFKVGTTTGDNIGPILDGVTLDLTGAIPEPSTWAMMIGGFALVGASMRRRKVNVQFA